MKAKKVDSRSRSGQLILEVSEKVTALILIITKNDKKLVYTRRCGFNFVRTVAHTWNLYKDYRFYAQNTLELTNKWGMESGFKIEICPRLWTGLMFLTHLKRSK